VLQRLPPRVGGVRLRPVGPQPGKRLGDQVGPDVGHPAQKDEAELPPRQSLHAVDSATKVTSRPGTTAEAGPLTVP
jgi:hypothetical protein